MNTYVIRVSTQNGVLQPLPQETPSVKSTAILTTGRAVGSNGDVQFAANGIPAASNSFNYDSANVVLRIGNSTVNTTTNSTSFSGTSNNALYFGGYQTSFFTNASNIDSGVMSYSRIPSEIGNSLAQVSIPGNVPPNTLCMIVPITQDTDVPANFANSFGYAITTAAADAPFTVKYTRSGVTTTIGTFTFTNTSSSAVKSTQSINSLVAGDVLLMYTPSDSVLADVGITMVLNKK